MKAQPIGAVLWKQLQIYQVFGANTNVGKTIFSTLLSRVAKSSKLYDHVYYLKPVSTGALDDADTRHIERFAPNVIKHSFYQFDQAVSPHIAALEEVKDSVILNKMGSFFREKAQLGHGFMLVEGAGGPHSPAPSGTSQLKLYRPLRLPCIFVADSNLGGISTSISAFESLLSYGYDIDMVAIFENEVYQNHDYLRQYFEERRIPFFVSRKPPQHSSQNDASNMMAFYGEQESLMLPLISQLKLRHDERLATLAGMAETAHKHIWYPFTQHKHMLPSDVTVIDSAFGDYFQTYLSNECEESGVIRSSYDGSASWWTQGLGHGNQQLATAAVRAAGRYGHVMFASAIHEPALALTQKLLACLRNPKLNRVFFSDNGSTAMEVAVKMGLKATTQRYGLGDSHKELEILGLRNSYHGDTLGTMDMSEPSVFNNQISWYKGRGHWFETPFVQMKKGKWTIRLPDGLRELPVQTKKFDSLQDVFDRSRDKTEDALVYRKHILQGLERLVRMEKRKFGALVMEPVVLGAGGMVLVDPLFQRTLAEVVNESSELLFDSNYTKITKENNELLWQGVPIISDEVFTGLYRLGHATSSSLLGIKPDISVHAKLLTGGLLPLATTVASEDIFNSFIGEGKADSLLHGHSYTAHAIGCAVASASIDILEKQNTDGTHDYFKNDWALSRGILSELASSFKDASSSLLPKSENDSAASSSHMVWSVWSKSFIERLSHHKSIEGVWALGSVLSIVIKDEAGQGYVSEAAKNVRDWMYHNVQSGWNIHSRVLGNVLYLMASQVSREEDIRLWEDRVEDALSFR